MWAFIGAALLVCAGHVQAWPLTGVVIKVSDGDTVALLDSRRQTHKIRLAGIDAPERDQPDGPMARQALRAALINRDVTADCRTVDRYGREVCALYQGADDVGMGMLRAGLAWHYTAYSDDQPPGEAKRYARAEKTAREAKRGLWSEVDPMPPWQWRHAKAGDRH